VERDREEGTYTIYEGERRAGVARYRDEDGARVFTHTEVDPAFGGRGLAGRLARRALDDARAEGVRVVARCSYIAGYLEKHEEYADLVR
jgi:uncharacterized protein